MTDMRPGVHVRGSLRTQSIRLIVALCLLVALCGVLIIGAVLVSRQAEQNQEQMNHAEQLSRAMAADVAAGSDALRGLELAPSDTKALSIFVTRQVQVTDDADAMARLELPSNLRASQLALLAATRNWVSWAGGQSSLIREGIPAADAEGDPERQDVSVAANDFYYRSDSLASSAQATADLTSAIVIWATVGGVLLGVVGLSMLVISFFRWNLRPMERLARVAVDLAAGRPAEITPVEGTTELLELAAALEQWRRSMEGRVAVADATLRMSGQAELEPLLEAGGVRLAEALDAEMVSFNLRGRDGSDTPHLYVRSTGSLTVVGAAPAGSPSLVAGTEQRIVVTDLRDESTAPQLREIAATLHLGPALSLPMISGGRFVGTLSFSRRDDRPGFSEADVELASFSVVHVAAAIHVVELLADLTEANARLGEANRHKSEFLAHMSHELRTPLNSVLGFAQLLSDDSFGPLSDRQSRYVGHIRSSGEHLLVLINDVLDLSKVEAGQLEMALETLRVSALIEDCIGDLRPLADAKRLQLTSRVAGRLAVTADQTRLAQIVLNLLSNAIKFTPAGGRVSVSAEADGAEVVISVRDSGIGIPRNEQERIFDAFFQVAGGRTRAQEGTGLGLALSRRLVELMGGTLTVSSRVGRGSTFAVRLPGAAVEAIAPEPEHQLAAEA